jgi:pyrroline-5-carboxylate reductase
MPNIAASIGESITAFCVGRTVTDEERRTAISVLGTFGDTVEVKESQMDAVTALSGSGPAYIAIIIDAMISAGLKVGLSREIAFRLVTRTLTGTADLLNRHPLHPAELRDAVTTPAGTTIAGIYELEKGSVRTSIMNAVEAATEASKKVALRFDGELNV